MDTFTVGIIILGILILLGIIIYARFYTNSIEIISEKINLKLTIVILFKNNEEMLKSIFPRIISLIDKAEEIVFIDLGSFDNSAKIINSYSKKYDSIKYYNLLEKMPVIKIQDFIARLNLQHSTLLVDLYKLSQSNPSVHTSDLSKVFDDSITTNISLPVEKNINGMKLLEIMELERRKNLNILNNYILEGLCNVKSHLEHPQSYEDLNEVTAFIDNIIKNTRQVSMLIGFKDIERQNLPDRITSILKEVSESYNLNINYKSIGIYKQLDSLIEDLIVDIFYEIVYVLLKDTSYFNMSTVLKFKEDNVQLLFTADTLYSLQVSEPSEELPYYVFQSIQNRLNLINGLIKIKLTSKNKSIIWVNIPNK
jgi:hypothetical protein